MDGFPRTAGEPSTLIDPWLTGNIPRAARSRVVFPEPFGSEHADKFMLANRKADIGQDRAPSQHHRDVGEFECVHCVSGGRALSTATSSFVIHA